MSKRHPCFAKANKALKPHNTELDMGMTLGVPSGQLGEGLIIQTKKISNTRDGKKPLRVFATFCPFCGTKL